MTHPARLRSWWLRLLVVGLPMFVLSTGPKSTGAAAANSASVRTGGPAHRATTSLPTGDREGAAAIAELGSNLESVARAHHWSGTRLAGTLTRDHSLHLDGSNRLLYVDEALPAVDTGGYAGVVPPTGMSQGEVFSLASRPSATKTIFLDFDGSTVAGTHWNSNYHVTSITTPPFSIDADTSSFSQAELDAMVAVWSAVAEDYAPFNVNVTTAQPLQADLVKSSSGDTRYGTTVAIGSNTWFPAAAGGVAFLDSFGSASDSPVFVFSDALKNTAKYIAEAASHEVGHSFGLSHDGSASTEYYRGQGDWAPIMGVGYYEPIVQWSKGEYAGANNTEDDVAIVASKIGFAADVEGGPTSAVPLGALPATTAGVISTASDIDRFSFVAPGPTTITLTPRARHGNLVAALDVVDAQGVTVASSGPASLADMDLSVVLQVDLVAGQTYRVDIDGVGDGDPTTDGYSDYDSMGGYTLTVEAATRPNRSPVAGFTATPNDSHPPVDVSFSSADSSDPDSDPITYAWDFGDGGTSEAADPVHAYLAAGTYTVSLTVTDSHGASDTTTRSVATNPNHAPMAGFTATPISGFALAGVNFSSAGSSDPDSDPITYTWDFGDRTTSTEADPTHVYAVPGTFVVTLTVTDPSGLHATVTTSVTMKKPVAAHVYVLVSKVARKHAARTLVTVIDAKGRRVSGVSVAGTWSGRVTGMSPICVTNRLGQCVLASSTAPGAGSIRFTVTAALMPAGRTWDQVRTSRLRRI